MPSEELDAQLRAFLEESRADRVRGYTNQAILQRLVEHAAEDARRFDELATQLRSQRVRIENVEVKADKNEERIGEVRDDVRDLKQDLKVQAREVEEITGSHHIPPLGRTSFFGELGKGAVKYFVWAALAAAGGGFGALVHALLSSHH